MNEICQKEIKKVTKICSVKENSFYLGISERRIQQLSNINILPKIDRGKYELFSCLTAYFRFLRRLLRKYISLYKDHVEVCLKGRTNFRNLPWYEDIMGEVPELKYFTDEEMNKWYM